MHVPLAPLASGEKPRPSGGPPVTLATTPTIKEEEAQNAKIEAEAEKAQG